MDGSHFNSKGVALFTERLGPTLLQLLHDSCACIEDFGG